MAPERIAMNFFLRMIALAVFILSGLALRPPDLSAQNASSNSRLPAQPQILGIAHVAIDVSDLNAARSFYKDTLGFTAPFSIQHTDGSDWIGYLKINDQQYIELFAASEQLTNDFDHVAFYTNDVAGMRTAVMSHGMKLLHDVHQGRTGDVFFSFRDPDGRIVEILEYKLGSLTSRTKNSDSPDRIAHIGLPGGLSQASRSFYRDVLGLEEISGTRSDVAAMQIPNGTDYIEFLPAGSQVNESCEIFLSSGKSLCR